MSVELGAGLIGIGREWGHAKKEVPKVSEAATYLNAAYTAGIRFFDTAPAYGFSETRLGAFLSDLHPAEREDIVVATKFGEYWDSSTSHSFVDHSYDALIHSFTNSLNILKKIDVLQLHKSSTANILSDETLRAFEYAREHGVKVIGASVSDEATAEIVCESDTYDLLQVPFNEANKKFKPYIEQAAHNGKLVVVNRPFQMGAILMSDQGLSNRHNLRVRAFEAILETPFEGYILTGTSSPQHLAENLIAFQEAENK